MSSHYQQAFDSLFQFTQDEPHTKLSERTFEWESGGNHRQVHVNHQITVEGSWEERPYMLIYQDDPPKVEELGLELFLSAMQVQTDLIVQPKGMFSFLKRGKIKVPGVALSHLLFTAPREYREGATRLATQPELEIPLSTMPWNKVKMIAFQEGSGVSIRFAPTQVMSVSHEWLREHLSPILEILLYL